MSDLLLIIINIWFRSFYYYHLILILGILSILLIKRPFVVRLILNSSQRTIETKENKEIIGVRKTDQILLLISHTIGIDKWAAYAGSDDPERTILRIQMAVSSDETTNVIAEIKHKENYQLLAPFIEIGKIIATSLDLNFIIKFDQTIKDKPFKSQSPKSFENDDINRLDQFGRSFERGKIRISDKNLEIEEHYLVMKIFFALFSLVLLALGFGFLLFFRFLLLQSSGKISVEWQVLIFIYLVIATFIGNLLFIFPIQELLRQLRNTLYRFSYDKIAVLDKFGWKETVRQQIFYDNLEKIMLIKQWYSWYRVVLLGSDDIIIINITVYKEKEGIELLETVFNILDREI